MITSMIFSWAPKQARYFSSLSSCSCSDSLPWFILIINFGYSFLTLFGIGLPNYSTQRTLGVTWEFFIFLAEPTYMDIKLNDFPFVILKSSQNLELDQILTRCKSTFIKLSRSNLYVNQNPPVNLSDSSG